MSVVDLRETGTVRHLQTSLAHRKARTPPCASTPERPAKNGRRTLSTNFRPGKSLTYSTTGPKAFGHTRSWQRANGAFGPVPERTRRDASD